ncbi:MAG: DUF1311 domain-containing protein [Coriobacteriia bacterium]|nr:DUF1311 domain-containing protein [Coriobacteriia bacterium]
MKKVVIVCLAICLLAIAGCGKKAPVSNSAKTGLSDSAALEQRRTTALRALGDVLLGKTTLLSTNDTNTAMYISDVVKEDVGGSSGGGIRLARLAVVDMDGDGVPEVIAEISDDYPEFYEILHYQNGKVYGASYGNRGIEQITKTGLFSGSSGALDNSISKLRFLGDTFDMTDQAYTESSAGSMPVHYYFYDVPLTEDAYKKAASTLMDSQVDWYDYSDSQIAKWVTDRSVSIDPKPALSNADLVARQKYLDGLAANSALNDPESNDAYATAGTLEADNLEVAYYQSWDKELNKVYSLLEKKLPADQMDTLRKDEKQWITVRDENGTFAYQNWMKETGIDNAERADQAKNSRLAEMTKNRTLYLIDRYFGDTSQPTTTEIIQKYGLEK